MVFQSIAYLIYLPLVVILFYSVKENLRWSVLFLASIVFYASFSSPYLLVVLSAVTLITYRLGLLIDKAGSPAEKTLLLWTGIACNVSVLAVLKYFSYLSSGLSELMVKVSPAFSIPVYGTLITVGVSYYILQAISYLTDIYLETEQPETHLGLFSLYMWFFPKLLQGPIERIGDFRPQLSNSFAFDYDRTKSGMILFTWGLLKKCVIANSMAQLVDPAYNNVGQYSGLSLLFATYCYYVQIYFDFSGYTDMARGSARLFNIDLTQNFDRPYLATSIANFWRRWHISFSRWILDYIFKPLQMHWRGHKTSGIAAALVVTFFLSGLWHGASWCFILWGLVHGMYMASSIVYKPYQKSLYKSLRVKKGKMLSAWQTFITFNLVTFSWIFFRANSVRDAFDVFRKILTLPVTGMKFTELLALIEIFGKKDLVIVVALLGAILLIESEIDKISEIRFNVALRWCSYVSLLMVIMFFSRLHNSSEFIYMSF